MNPILIEYLLKGVFLGLWAYLAVVQPPAEPDWPTFGRAVGIMVAGLGVGLLAGTVVQIRRGLKPWANSKAFPLLVLTETPFWIFAGVVGGLAAGVVAQYDPPEDRNWLGYFVVGGLALGYGFHQLRQVKEWAWRFGIAAVLGAGLVAFAVLFLERVPGLDAAAAQQNFGIYVLLGLPFFYLLTFCAEAEESEVEIAALCAGLGVGLYLAFAGQESVFGGKAIFLAPVAIYFVYVTRMMPGLKVFKHTLRGYGHLHLHRLPDALISFRKALKHDPKNALASEGMWTLHQRIDVTTLPPDAEILKYLDYQFCLDQAALYLVGDRAPTADERTKAGLMLDLVERQQPRLAARVDYLRAVALAHAKQYDAAAAALGRLLDPGVPYDAKFRKPVLLPAWDLALRLHPELVKRLGPAELAKPGRRMEAIGAVERALAADPADSLAAEHKPTLYAGLTEAEFVADAASGPPADFNYDHAEQLGLALADDADPTKRDRGASYLRIAGRGLPHRGPGIFAALAAWAEKYGKPADVPGYLEQVKRSALQVGPKALAEDQRAIYFDALKKLSAAAEAGGDYEAAVADLRLYLEAGKSELETYRKLADLHEKAKDPLNALLMTETALQYSSKDRDLLDRKDRYYYSVEPERLKQVRDKVEPWFDTRYCATKARQILDGRDADLGLIDWALHLARLARVMTPDANAARLAEARALLRKGERDSALQLLEDLREAKRGGGDEEEAWFLGAKILGDLYLNDFQRPDLAVACYLDYREHSKSGADTLFMIAKCYEAAGDTKNALNFYETVTAYDQHPRYWDATEAVRRLKGTS